MRINLKILSIILAVLILAAVTKSQPIGTDPNIRDTVSIQSMTTSSTNNGFIPVYFYNDQPLAGIELTMTYSSLDIMIDSFSFVGSRVENYSLRGADQLTTSSITVYTYALAEGLIPDGSGLLGNIYFSFIPGITPQTIAIDTLTITISEREYSTAFSDENANAFSPIINSGTLTIGSESCCLGDRGNINNSPDDLVNVADLVYFVNYIFREGPEPICLAEANVNGSPDEIINVSDLVYLVAYMFQEGPPIPSCP